MRNNTQSQACSASATNFNARVRAFASKWRSSPTISRRLIASLKRSDSKAIWKTRRLARPGSFYSIATSFANTSWASLGRLTGHFQAARWHNGFASAKARTRTTAGLWRTLRGALGAHCERCERRRLSEGNETGAAQLVGLLPRLITPITVLHSEYLARGVDGRGNPALVDKPWRILLKGTSESKAACRCRKPFSTTAPPNGLKSLSCLLVAAA